MTMNQKKKRSPPSDLIDRQHHKDFGKSMDGEDHNHSSWKCIEEAYVQQWISVRLMMMINITTSPTGFAVCKQKIEIMI